ncbi:MAG: proline--tRNA ligase, partial [Patescibacteria group bacterium]
MRQSKLFTKTLRNDPKEARTISHKLLVRAGYINQLTSGIWSLLPLGWRVYKKIEKIIREEMNEIGGQEVYLPTLQPKELWQKTGRWETIDPPLFKVKDRHNKWLGLGSTHEEVITDLARQYIKSYKDLPLAIYQIQNKFRNEMRPTGGLLRTREFIMKDLYSFHADEKDLDKYYKQVLSAYYKIYERCGLKAIAVSAPSGSIGGSVSHEFMILADSGEDKILICQNRDWGINLEIGRSQDKCPNCSGKLEQKNAIEAGHTFKLGALYSQKMGASFTDRDGQKK